MRYWIFFLLAGCQSLLNEQIPIQEPLMGARIFQGMSREEIVSILGHPVKQTESPFQREQWVYPHIPFQLTYSNQEEPTLYLFKREGVGESTLSLLFDENGNLDSFSYSPCFPSNQNFLAGDPI